MNVSRLIGAAALALLATCCGARAQVAGIPIGGGGGPGSQILPSAGTVGDIVVVGPLAQGVQDSGIPLIIYSYITSPPRPSMYIGANSGSFAITPSNWNVALGQWALAFQTTGTESTAIGALAGQNLTTGILNTAIGMHSIGQETTTLYNTAVGVDAMRDTVGQSSSVAVGLGALRDASGGTGNTAVGYFSSLGNAGSLTVSGSATTNDVVSVAITTANGNVVGVPVTPTYTVQMGDTLANIATGIAAAITAANITITDAHGNNALTSYGLSLVANTVGNIVAIEAPGGTTNGWQLTYTPSVSGSATEVITVAAAPTGSSNTSLGWEALLGPNRSTAGFNTAIGASALAGLTTGSNNVAVGVNAGQVQTTAGNNTLLGTNAGALITTGQSNTIVGSAVASTVLTTGINNIFIGINNAITASSSSQSNTIQIGTTGGNIWSVTGTDTPSTAANTITGTLKLPNVANAAGNEILCFASSTGLVTYEPSVATCVPSALMFKNPLGTIDPWKALDKLVTLTPAKYTYKDEATFGAGVRDGLYADEVCSIDENLCVRDADGRVKNYDKVGINSYFVAAFQALKSDNDNLRTCMDSWKCRLFGWR